MRKLPKLRLAGVDGCRRGWVVATEVGATVVESFAEIVAERFDLVLIDIPIGLLDEGRRRCDMEARALLGLRKSSVFPAPSRSLLAQSRYAGQCSVQLWNILAKIREVDTLMTPRLQQRVREGHPECSFALMKGAPLLHAKKTRPGELERRRLLSPRFDHISDLPGAARDDLLDAHALLWSAERAAHGEAHRLGDPDERDPHRLRCEIIA